MASRNPFLERWSTPEGSDRAWEALVWLLHGGERPVGFGVTEQGRLDLRGLVMPEPVELAKAFVPGAAPGGGFTVTETSGKPKVHRREWVDLDLSFCGLPWLWVTESEWTNCLFDDTSLYGARIWDTTVTDCSFQRCDLRELAVGSSRQPDRERWWRRVSFGKSVLGDVLFSGWRAADVTFTGAKLSKVSFDQCTISRATFTGKLDRVEFECRPLTDEPTPGPITDTDFSDTVFGRDTFLRGAHLDRVTFPEGVVVVPSYPLVARRAVELLAGAQDEDGVFIRRMLAQDLRVPGDEDASFVLARRDIDQGDPADPFANQYFGILAQAARQLGVSIDGI